LLQSTRKHADLSHPLALLCARREWPCTRADEVIE
jgi:hypothetical protein